MLFCLVGARDSAPCRKWWKREGLKADSRMLAGVGHLKKICKDACHTWIKHVKRSGRWFPERGCNYAQQIFKFATMILRDRCSASYDLGSLLRGRRATDGMEKSQNTMARSRQLCTQLSIFERSLAELLRFWCCQLRKLKRSCRRASFFNIVKFKIWGCLAKLLCFKRCQVQKKGKTRRLAAFSSLQIDR